jgi:hypothetical protein
VAEAATLLPQEVLVPRILHEKVFQRVRGIVALKTEVFAGLDEKGGIGLTVRIMAGSAAADRYGPVNVALLLWPGMAFSAKVGIVFVDAVGKRSVGMAERAVVLGDDTVGAVEPVGHFLGNGGIVEEIDRQGHDVGSAEPEDVDPFLKTEDRGEDAFPGVEDDVVVVDVQRHLLDGRIRDLSDEGGRQVVEDGVVDRRKEGKLAGRLAVIVGAVAGKAELSFQHAAAQKERLVPPLRVEVVGVGIVAGDAGKLSVRTEMQILGNLHGRTYPDPVIEVVLESGFVTLLAEAVDALAKDPFLNYPAGSGDEDVAVSATHGLEVVRIPVTGSTGRNNKQKEYEKRRCGFLHGRNQGRGSPVLVLKKFASSTSFDESAAILAAPPSAASSRAPRSSPARLRADS